MPFVPDETVQATKGRFVPDAPSGDVPKGADLEAKAQAITAEETPEWERRAAAVGRSMSAPFEAVGQVAKHVMGQGKEADAAAQERARAMQALEKASAKETAGRKPVVPRSALNLPVNVLEDVLTKASAGKVGTATDITTGMLAPILKIPGVGGWLGRVLSGGATGAAYGGLEPVVTGGDFATEKAKQVAKAGGAGAGTAGLFELGAKVPGLFKKAPPAAEREVSESAQGVTSEMQRIRDVMEGRAEPRRGAGASEFERAKVDFDETMKSMRDRAFAEGGMVEIKPTLDLIAKLESKNPDAQVRRALREVKSTLSRATESAAESALPAAGARMTPAEFRALQGKGEQLDLPMLDEVRQSINRMIEQSGDKALSGHTKDLLAQVRDSITAKTPEGYRTYLSQFAKGAEDLKKYHPEQTVLGKITDKRTNPAEALADVFGGKSNEADLRSLVQMAGHDEQALGSVRKSLGEWLTKPDPQTKVVSTTNLLNRWDKVRGAAKESGLMSEDHVSAVDSVLKDLREKGGKGKIQRGLATVGGFLAGSFVGHPFIGAHTMRDMITAKGTEKARKQASDMVMELAVGNEEAAKLLAKPATAENMSEFNQHIQQILAMGAGRTAAQSEPPRKRKMDQLGGLPNVPK